MARVEKRKLIRVVLDLAYRIGVVCVWISLLPCAIAQTNSESDSKWEVEVHGGRSASSHPSNGVGALPSPGSSFTTTDGNPSRFVDSWFFGDGALLLNQIQALSPSSSQRITSLDSILTSAVVQRDSGGIGGVRLSRRLNSRLSAEFTADYCACPLRMTAAGRSAIEASSESYYSTWTSLFTDWKSTAPVAPFSVSEGHSVDDGKGSQIFTTGTLNIALRTRGKLIPYVAVGGGMGSNNDSRPSANLEGAFAHSVPASSANELVEGTTVTMNFSLAGKVFAGVVGGGIKYSLNPRWGLRFDARMHLSRDPIDTLVDIQNTSFGCQRCSTNPVTYAFGGDPGIQISNTRALSLGIPSSLHVNPQVAFPFRTFRPSGIQIQGIITVGVFRRF